MSGKLIFVLALVLSFIITPLQTFALEYNDVSPNHPFYPYISTLSDLGIVKGFPDGLFYPEESVTRGQLAKIIYYSLELPQNLDCQEFIDVPNTHNLYIEIQSLKCLGIVNGIQRDRFMPDTIVTRGQVVKIAILSLEKAGFTFNEFSKSEANFSDVLQSHVFYDYINRAYRSEIISGFTESIFSPDTDMTRGAVTKVASNTRKKIIDDTQGLCWFEEAKLLQISNSYFAKPATPLTLSRGFSCDHDGLDITGNLGQDVVAIDNGIVIRKDFQSGGFGNFIFLKHTLPSGQKVYSLYAHLQELPSLAVGSVVVKNQVIGKMGSTGSATGIHLHFMMISDSYETTKNVGCRYGGSTYSKCHDPQKYIP